MSTNNFVPFCNDNTGTNLLSQAAYLADPDLPIGNQPGIARSALVNKAIRQASTIAAIVAQVISDQLSVDMLDDYSSSDHVNPPKLYLAAAAQLRRLAPVITRYTSGSGSHNLTTKFFIATPSVAPTATATYSDGTTTFTVSVNYDGVSLNAKGGALPVATSGTLTKTGGTGDATLTYYAYRIPLALRLRMVGAGGGGSGGGTSSSGGAGTDGGDTTFGAATAGGGKKGTAGGGGGAGGGATLGGYVGIASDGSSGSGGGATSGTSIFASAGGGGSSAFGGAGGGGSANSIGLNAAANSGSGGGGGATTAATSNNGGGGGGSGAYIDVTIPNPAITYAYGIGAKGTQGAAGTSGFHGGDGSDGQIEVEEHYQ